MKISTATLQVLSQYKYIFPIWSLTFCVLSVSLIQTGIINKVYTHVKVCSENNLKYGTRLKFIYVQVQRAHRNGGWVASRSRAFRERKLPRHSAAAVRRQPGGSRGRLQLGSGVRQEGRRPHGESAVPAGDRERHRCFEVLQKTAPRRCDLRVQAGELGRTREPKAGERAAISFRRRHSQQRWAARLLQQPASEQENMDGDSHLR